MRFFLGLQVQSYLIIIKEDSLFHQAWPYWPDILVRSAVTLNAINNFVVTNIWVYYLL